VALEACLCNIQYKVVLTVHALDLKAGNFPYRTVRSDRGSPFIIKMQPEFSLGCPVRATSTKILA
jgi:hypothetical protein